MTIPDLPDWGQPVSLIEQVTPLSASPFAVSGAGASTPVMDTSGYNSLSLLITRPNSASGNQYGLQWTWFEGANQVDYDAITFHSLPSYPLLQTNMGVQIPVRGSSARFSGQGDTGDPWSVVMLGSTRDLPGDRTRVSQVGGSRLLGSVNFGSLGAGVTSNPVFVPPVGRAYRFRLNQKISQVQLTIQPVLLTGTPLSTNTALVMGGADIANQGAEVVLPLTALSVTATNNDTSAHTTTATFWDVS